MGSAGWLLLALAVSAEHGFATASVSAELRGSAPLQNGSTTTSVNPELSIQPTLDVGYVAGALRAAVGYHPQFTLTNLTPTFLHRIQGSGEWRLSASRRALVDQQLSFGQYDTSLGNLGQAEGGLFPGLLPLGIVDYLTSDTAAGFDGALVPRLRLRAAVGYHVSGGLTETSRTALPLEQGPRLTLELQHEVTRRDSASLYLKTSGDRFAKTLPAPDQLAAVVEGGMTWRSTLARETALTFGAGGAAVVSAPVGEQPVPYAVPVGSAGVSYGVPRLRVSVDANFAPQADARSGEIFQRVGVSASSEYKPRGDLTARASFGGTWSLGTVGANAGGTQSAGDRSLLGEASLAWHEGVTEISGGLRGANVSLSGTAATELRAYVAFSLKAAAVR